jgi:NAD(P)-dependent dehydrogenase (short-subunit alcohol dehydrogenase family)
MTGRLAGRIALITGASRGIGAATAVRYAQEGAHVVLVARTVGGLEEVDDQVRAVGGTATLVPLDLRQLDGIDNLGPALLERFGRLDVLLGNAATLGVLSPLGHIQASIWDEVLAVNVTANWRLIRIFDPLLRRSDSGRAIFVTSDLAQPAAYWGPYTASKAALEALVRTYAAEVASTAVRANLVDPGPTRTSMRALAFPGEDPLSLPPPEHVCETMVRMAEAHFTGNGLSVPVDRTSTLSN